MGKKVKKVVKETKHVPCYCIGYRCAFTHDRGCPWWDIYNKEEVKPKKRK